VRSGDCDERTHIGKFTFAAARRRLKKLGRNQIPVDFAARPESLSAQIRAAVRISAMIARDCLELRPNLSCH
jgi:hypothetical protein